MPAQYGLIGYPLAHSFSPAWFKEKFAREGVDATYKAYPLAHIADINGLLANYPLCGLNVTIPYKESVIEFLNEMDDAAQAVNAVNCIDLRNGRRKGYNTDIIGFELSLKPLLKPQHTKALVLGTGGAAKAVIYVLDKLGIITQSVSRGGNGHTIGYEELTDEIVNDHTLIINTTPLGMSPDVEAAPDLPYHAIGVQHLLYDLVYNPAETKFLSLGRAQGAIIKNGHEMLVLQAEASWEIWNNAE